MRATGRNTGTSMGDDPSKGRRREQVDIHGLKVWVKANLPKRSHLCGILLLEEDLLTAEAFLAKMDIWLKLIELEGNSLN